LPWLSGILFLVTHEFTHRFSAANRTSVLTCCITIKEKHVR